MELLNKLETTIAGWVKNVPHLPPAGQKWLGQNVWWIVLIGAIISGIALLFAISGLMALLAALSVVTYYVPGAAVGALGIIGAIAGLVFLIGSGILLAMAVKPLQAGKKQGWTLLFASWLVNVVSVVVSAVLSFNVFGFIFGILFGAIGIAISGYFLFEIHNQFVHVKSVKKAAKKA